MKRDEIINYWIKGSDENFKTMKHLFESKDYSWALFLGHLVLEKLLKAYYIKAIDINVPLIHDLLRIAEKSGLNLTSQQKDFLDLVTTFNIQTRYDDYKMEFFKKCTLEFTEINIQKITEFREWIRKQL